MIKRIVALLLVALVFTVAFGAEKHRFTLVIDAGHGGKDPGTLGKYSKEKTISLSVALAFGRYVEQNCPDVKVIYTRKTDVFIPLKERAAIANRNKADVFISIHVNSVQSRKPITGLETYTMGMRRSDEKLSAAMRENEAVLIEKDYKQHYAGFDPRSPESYIIFEMINDANMLESVELAKKIQRHVCKTANRPNKGVKQDAFLVLRETSMPACLIELGYISTPSEETYLNNKQNIDALGLGIYQAFAEYKKSVAGGPAPKVAVAQPEAQPEPEQKETPEKKADTQEKKAAPEKKAKTSENADSAASGPTDAAASASSAPTAATLVFKVQFMTSDKRLKAGDRLFKGLTGVDSYKEGALWKYTVGNSADYDEILRLRREVAKKFPQAFVIAYKDGKKMDTQAAIVEYKNNKKQKAK